MKEDPLFCFPLADDASYAAYLSELVSRTLQAPADAAEVNPLVTRTIPRRAVEARLSILKEVYAGEYYTDSFDFARLVERVRLDREFIWFWGTPSEARRLLDIEAAECPRLGSVSVVDVSDEFGPGYGEICRSGSLSEVRLLPYAVKRILDFITGGIPALTDAFHTLQLVPRVRSAEQGIRGGKAVNTIHKKYIRSRFWGFAPWYVMQGGYLECLEYREVNRSFDALLAGASEFPTCYCRSADEAQFIGALLALNFERPSIGTRVAKGKPNATIHLRRRITNPPSIAKYNHVSYAVTSGDPSDGTLDSFEFDEEAACAVVDVDHSDEASVSAQQMLFARGFRLTNIRVPRVVTLAGAANTRSFPLYGSWARPNPGWPIAAPHYHRRSGSSSDEQRVIDHLASLLAHWEAARRPSAA